MLESDCFKTTMPSLKSLSGRQTGRDNCFSGLLLPPINCDCPAKGIITCIVYIQFLVFPLSTFVKDFVYFVVNSYFLPQRNTKVNTKIHKELKVILP
jgi:hypothetical protein